MRKLLLSMLALATLPGAALHAQNITGTWQGALKLPTAELRTVFKISLDDDKLKAVFYSIDQPSPPINVNVITRDGTSVKMTIATIGGSYEGRLTADGNTITGNFSQGGIPLPLTLTKATPATAWTIPEAPPPPRLNAQAPTSAIVLGVGSPNIDAERSGTSIGIVAGGTLYLFDAGPGVERRIMEARPKLEALQVRRLGPVFITHTHRDHTAGLAALLAYHSMSGSMLVLSPAASPSPMTVYGPDGGGEGEFPSIVDMMDHLRAAFVLGPRDKVPVQTIKIMPGRVYEDSVLKVNAFKVDHIPNSFGFRVETPDRVIVISGDTSPSEAVVDACNGCDLLFHEVYGPPKIEGPLGAYHTDATALGEIARRARPKKLVTYHYDFVPHQAALEAIKKSFSGEVTFARDLDTF